MHPSEPLCEQHDGSVSKFRDPMTSQSTECQYLRQQYLDKEISAPGMDIFDFQRRPR